MRLSERERRRHRRHSVCFPVRLDSAAKSDRLGMCRNGSAFGMLFGTPSVFAIGDELTLTFRVNAAHPNTRVTGRVVWLGREQAHRDSWCHHLVAVEFDTPHPELVPYFEAEEPRQAKLFDGVPLPSPCGAPRSAPRRSPRDSHPSLTDIQ